MPSENIAFTSMDEENASDGTDLLHYYSNPGIMTDPGRFSSYLAELPREIERLCQVIQGLLIHKLAARLYGERLSGLRTQEIFLRSFPQMLERLLEIDDHPLTVARLPCYRLVGNCRDFSVMLCSILRYQGIPARARCGFGSYLEQSDHWVCEYWKAKEQRWVMVDAQLDEMQREAFKIDFDPYDVPREQFLVAGRAWQMCRAKQTDWRIFGFKRWRGRAFVCDSVIRDFVALNKVEVLAWDSWWDKHLAEEAMAGSERTLAYLDHLATLTLAENAHFTVLRTAYESDPRIYPQVMERWQREQFLLASSGTVPLPASTSDISNPRAALAEALASASLAPVHIQKAVITRQTETVPQAGLEPDKIEVHGAQQHNLKNIDIMIPRYKLVVLTGVSGSGKSSLAFDTIYAEGQRRYIESLSPYVRHLLEKVEKPRVDFIRGLSPAIAIEQKTVSHNPRSTVGTVTEIADYIRLLFSRVGIPYCLSCGHAIYQQSSADITAQLMALPHNTSYRILAPLVRQIKGDHSGHIEQAHRNGYTWLRVDGMLVNLHTPVHLNAKSEHTLELVVAEINAPYDQSLLSLQVRTALHLGNGALIVDLGEGHEVLLGEQRRCPRCGIGFPELTSQHFSPNSALGMCPTCHGLGTKLEVDPDLVIDRPHLSLLDGASRAYGNIRKNKSKYSLATLQALAQHYNIDLELSWRELPQIFRDIVLYGSDEKIKFNYQRDRDDGSWSAEAEKTTKGLIYQINRLFRQTKSDSIRNFYRSFMSQQPCSACGGARLSIMVRSVKLNGKAIHEIGQMTIEQLLDWIEELSEQLQVEQQTIADEVLYEVQARLSFMINVGLHYLTLDRTAPSLSGGEGQRIHLASQLSGGLAGVLYVLDEPSIGLHARDLHTLLQTLLHLRDLGNTVLVVEHDAEIMRNADWLIDLGPGAGVLGGEIVANGTPKEVAANTASLTGLYLSGIQSVHSPLNKRREPNKGWFSVIGASLHNLKQIEARFPLGLLTCVTGVSGSGKSSLVNGTLYPALMNALHSSTEKVGSHERLEGLEHFNKVISVTQTPIGRTPRSNPATYIGIFDEIRKIFAATPKAQAHAYKADRFSFNVPGGRCESCKGYGEKVIEMHFLSDVWVPCKECEGKRFNQEILEILYKEKNIADVLDMDVQEALTLFAEYPRISRLLQTLHGVGLDYIKLGQSATTLSGGEAQRIKLAKELGRSTTGSTLYILDEPTTGLHFSDIQRLLDVLHRLVDAGNTVLIIEHNLDVIKTADWVIDLGPEGGEAGGYIIAQGTPETICDTSTGYTGKFLHPMLEVRRENRFS